jgi:hypothetical protein
MYDIYTSNHNDSWRYTLGKSGSRKIIVIGLNPSTATKEKSDPTVAKVAGVALRNGFDGFAMLNLYPIRSTKYKDLPHEVDDRAFSENLNRIEAFVGTEPRPVIWAAWGESIYARSYFTAAAKELLARLEKHSPTWQHFGPLTRSGQPRHPSRLQYAWTFSPLDTVDHVRPAST